MSPSLVWSKSQSFARKYKFYEAFHDILIKERKTQIGQVAKHRQQLSAFAAPLV